MSRFIPPLNITKNESSTPTTTTPTTTTTTTTTTTSPLTFSHCFSPPGSTYPSFFDITRDISTGTSIVQNQLSREQLTEDLLLLYKNGHVDVQVAFVLTNTVYRDVTPNDSSTLHAWDHALQWLSKDSSQYTDFIESTSSPLLLMNAKQKSCVIASSRKEGDSDPSNVTTMLQKVYDRAIELAFPIHSNKQTGRPQYQYQYQPSSQHKPTVFSVEFNKQFQLGWLEKKWILNYPPHVRHYTLMVVVPLEVHLNSSSTDLFENGGASADYEWVSIHAIEPSDLNDKTKQASYSFFAYQKENDNRANNMIYSKQKDGKEGKSMAQWSTFHVDPNQDSYKMYEVYDTFQTEWSVRFRTWLVHTFGYLFPGGRTMGLPVTYFVNNAVTTNWNSIIEKADSTYISPDVYGTKPEGTIMEKHLNRFIKHLLQLYSCKNLSYSEATKREIADEAMNALVMDVILSSSVDNQSDDQRDYQRDGQALIRILALSITYATTTPTTTTTAATNESASSSSSSSPISAVLGIEDKKEKMLALAKNMIQEVEKLKEEYDSTLVQSIFFELMKISMLCMAMNGVPTGSVAYRNYLFDQIVIPAWNQCKQRLVNRNTIRTEVHNWMTTQLGLEPLSSSSSSSSSSSVSSLLICCDPQALYIEYEAYKKMLVVTQDISSLDKKFEDNLTSWINTFSVNIKTKTKITEVDRLKFISTIRDGLKKSVTDPKETVSNDIYPPGYLTYKWFDVDKYVHFAFLRKGSMNTIVKNTQATLVEAETFDCVIQWSKPHNLYTSSSSSSSLSLSSKQSVLPPLHQVHRVILGEQEAFQHTFQVQIYDKSASVSTQTSNTKIPNLFEQKYPEHVTRPQEITAADTGKNEITDEPTDKEKEMKNEYLSKCTVLYMPIIKHPVVDETSSKTNKTETDFKATIEIFNSRLRCLWVNPLVQPHDLEDQTEPRKKALSKSTVFVWKQKTEQFKEDRCVVKDVIIEQKKGDRDATSGLMRTSMLCENLSSSSSSSSATSADSAFPSICKQELTEEKLLTFVNKLAISQYIDTPEKAYVDLEAKTLQPDSSELTAFLNTLFNLVNPSSSSIKTKVSDMYTYLKTQLSLTPGKLTIVVKQQHDASSSSSSKKEEDAHIVLYLVHEWSTNPQTPLREPKKQDTQQSSNSYILIRSPSILFMIQYTLREKEKVEKEKVDRTDAGSNCSDLIKVAVLRACYCTPPTDSVFVSIISSNEKAQSLLFPQHDLQSSTGSNSASEKSGAQYVMEKMLGWNRVERMFKEDETAFMNYCARLGYEERDKWWQEICKNEIRKHTKVMVRLLLNAADTWIAVNHMDIFTSFAQLQLVTSYYAYGAITAGLVTSMGLVAYTNHKNWNLLEEEYEAAHKDTVRLHQIKAGTTHLYVADVTNGLPIVHVPGSKEEWRQINELWNKNRSPLGLAYKFLCLLRDHKSPFADLQFLTARGISYILCTKWASSFLEVLGKPHETCHIVGSICLSTGLALGGLYAASKTMETVQNTSGLRKKSYSKKRFAFVVTICTMVTMATSFLANAHTFRTTGEQTARATLAGNMRNTNTTTAFDKLIGTIQRKIEEKQQVQLLQIKDKKEQENVKLELDMVKQSWIETLNESRVLGIDQCIRTLMDSSVTPLCSLIPITVDPQKVASVSLAVNIWDFLLKVRTGSFLSSSSSSSSSSPIQTETFLNSRNFTTVAYSIKDSYKRITETTAKRDETQPYDTFLLPFVVKHFELMRLAATRNLTEDELVETLAEKSTNDYHLENIQNMLTRLNCADDLTCDITYNRYFDMQPMDDMMTRALLENGTNHSVDYAFVTRLHENDLPVGAFTEWSADDKFIFNAGQVGGIEVASSTYTDIIMSAFGDVNSFQIHFIGANFLFALVYSCIHVGTNSK